MKMRIILNDKANNVLLQKDYDGHIMVYSTHGGCLVVIRNEIFVEKIWFSDYPTYDSFSIYNYD